MSLILLKPLTKHLPRHTVVLFPIGQIPRGVVGDSFFSGAARQGVIDGGVVDFCACGSMDGIFPADRFWLYAPDRHRPRPLLEVKMI